jgi:ribosomal protein S18 acetylase RimI-like enzyme
VDSPLFNCIERLQGFREGLACLEPENEGVGPMLLIDALRRAMQASEAAGLEIVLVDAIDSNAISFYARFGFTRHDLASNRMYISMIDLQNG